MFNYLQRCASGSFTLSTFTIEMDTFDTTHATASIMAPHTIRTGSSVNVARNICSGRVAERAIVRCIEKGGKISRGYTL